MSGLRRPSFVEVKVAIATPGIPSGFKRGARRARRVFKGLVWG